jgi:thioredoxin reductase
VTGVFAAGAVTASRYNQVATAVGEGAMAAVDAALYLESLNKSVVHP